MKIEPGKYTLKEFCKKIITSPEKDIFRDLHLHQVKIFLYLTEDDKWEKYFEDSYFLEDFGEITKLTGEYTDVDGKLQRTVFYANYFNNDILMIFTGATEEGVTNTLKKTVHNSNKMAIMPIFPKDFQKLNKKILNKYENVKITEFKSNRQRDLEDAEIRPKYDREIEYKGEDGRQTLQELRKYYGVVPVRIKYEKTDLSFKMDSSGKFTIEKINDTSFSLLFELVEMILEKVLEVQKVTQKIRFEMEDVESGNVKVRTPKLKAGKFSFSKKLTLYNAEKLVEITSSGKTTNFTLTDIKKEAGSLDFEARVTDEERGAYFNISANEDSMAIIPKKNCSFPSIIEFYHLFTKIIDEGAVISTFNGPGG